MKTVGEADTSMNGCSRFAGMKVYDHRFFAFTLRELGSHPGGVGPSSGTGRSKLLTHELETFGNLMPNACKESLPQGWGKTSGHNRQNSELRRLGITCPEKKGRQTNRKAPCR